jgi:hypothetical protein
MSDLSTIEKRKLERALQMGDGYLLNFSNRTFSEFFLDNFGIDIYDKKYEGWGTSKANRMRAFWNQERNNKVGQVFELLFSGWEEFKGPDGPENPPEECLNIAKRLKEGVPVLDIEVLAPDFDDPTFEALTRSIREVLDKNEPERGLDRLHTLVVMYFRALCEKRGIATLRETPLNSLVGSYVKVLNKEGVLESEMTERILKSSISIMEAFCKVRNDKSLAHENKLLNYNESALIFGYVNNSLRFIQAMEKQSFIMQNVETEEIEDFPF